MAILSKGKTFTATETVTSGKLHDLVDLATFAAGAKDGVTIDIDTNGALFVKEINTGQLANDSVTADKVDGGNGTFVFASIQGQRHLSIPHTHNHNSSGALTIDLFNGNFQVVNVSADITSVATMLNAPIGYAGGHFTFILRYTENGLNGPDDKNDWNAEWLLPSTYGGTLTMTNGAIDMISGVVFSDGGTVKYAVTSILDLSNPN